MSRTWENLPHPAEHGEFVPTKGWYGATMRGWRDTSASIRPMPAPPTPTDAQREEFKRMQAQARNDFRTNPQLERLAALRDSDRPEDRAKAEKLLEGRLRMNLAEYQSAKQAHESGA